MTSDQHSTKAPGSGVLRRVLAALPALTLLAVLTITASAEYALARTVLDLPPQIAWALPAAIDSYVLAALHTRRDVPAAIAVMAGALLASMGAHLAQVGRAGQPLPIAWTAPLATAIMTVLVIVAWRVHVLIGPDDRPTAVLPNTATDTDTAHRRTDVPGAAPVSGAALTPSVSAAPVAVVAAAREVPDSVTEPWSAGTTAVPARFTALDTRPAARASAAQDVSGTRSVSDDEILAAIGDEAPSIRALMREHGIGQGRATRLRRTILANQSNAPSRTPTTESTTEPTPPDQKPDEHHEQEENTAGNRQSSQKETIEEEMKNNTQASTDPELHRIASKGMTDTHTCITDRMGNSRSTKNGVDHDSAIETPCLTSDSPDFQAVPLDLHATAAGGS